MELNDAQRDFLKEVGMIGAGHAATGLSSLLGRKIMVSVPNSRIVPLTQLSCLVGLADDLVTGVIFLVEGDVKGAIVLILPILEGKKLAAIMTHKRPEEIKGLDDFSISAIKEAGNITTGSYLSALADFTGLKIIHSVPNYASDMLMSILDSLLIQFSLKADEAAVIESEFRVEQGGTVEGYMLFIPDTESLDLIFKKLQKEG